MIHDIDLYIATAKSSTAAKWLNKQTTWAAVAASLSKTVRTAETLKQYFSYSKQKQDEIKDVGGFVGGKLRAGTSKIKGKEVTYKEPHGWRRKGYVDHRQLVALDVDFGDLDAWLDFRKLGCAGLVYSTHKHTEANPRLRIVFPLDRPVSVEEYEAIARVIAAKIDIEIFDDTTYQPTRLMYYPSTAKDGAFVYDLYDAPVMVADDILTWLDDWTDVTSWPQSSRETEVKRIGSDNVEDPETKPGVIGAFCRSYPIEVAIEDFLSDVYEPCPDLGDDRYSFLAGSTAGGLVIYDHKHAYSHHNTDPAGGKLCNAFDLVRLHKFGDLDEGAKDGLEVSKLPSYKAMAAFASDLKEVKKELLRERRRERGNPEDYDSLETEVRDWMELGDWVEKLEMEGKQIKTTINNVVTILQNDERLHGCFGFNEFDQREVIVRRVPWDKPGKRYPRPMIDSDDAQIRLYLEHAYSVEGPGKIQDALSVVVRGNSFHPVKEYLQACTWDGAERLDTLLIDTLGAPDNEYVKAVTRKFFVGAVARIMQPGVKFDTMLTIVGVQGIGKSTLLARMGGAWFSDSLTTVQGKEAVEAIQGAWIIEVGELTGLRTAEVNATKHFISKTEDRYRVAYGKRVEYFPRACVFAGTTNEDDFLRDTSGNRRYWVVNCKGGGPIDFPVWEYLSPFAVSQIWAEAMEAYTAGESLILDATREADAKEVQAAHMEKDDRTGIVLEYLDRLIPDNWESLNPYERRQWVADPDNVGTNCRSTVCGFEIWNECFGKDVAAMTRKDSFEMGRIMKTLKGWEFIGVKRHKLYGPQKTFGYAESIDS